MTFHPQKIRSDFPMLRQSMHGKPLVYLDNAATTQKPTAVLDRMERFYRNDYATVNRGVYGLSQRATEDCAAAREKCRAFLHAQTVDEIVFTKGTTESLNLIAASYGRTHLGEGNEVVVSTLEHHSNIVPWQMVCEQRRAKLRVIPVNDRGEILLEEYKKLLSDRTKIVAVGHVSNALGTINPVADMAKMAHAYGAVVVIDGAQAAAHLSIDVQALDADFYCFSGHKLYGPTGIGVLYGKRALLETMPPYQGGGDMIEQVTFEKTTYAKPPQRFEAGTPPIAQIIGLGSAIDYMQTLEKRELTAYENELLAYATEAIGSFPGVTIIGTAREKASIVSFVMEGVHPHDIGTILDGEGIAIRAGHHCAQPTMKRFGVSATARVSLAFYNLREDIDRLVDGLKEVKRIFR